MIFTVRVIYDYPVIRVFTNKRYLYVNMRVNCDHLNIHVCTDKHTKMHGIFRSDRAGFCSMIVFTGYCFVFLIPLFFFCSQLM